jgi:peptidylprolyl isomerase
MKITTLGLIALIAAGCVAEQDSKSMAAKKSSGSAAKKTVSTQLADGIYATISTNRGPIVLSLEFEKTPLTVANFVGLSEGSLKNNAKPMGTPFYDGLIFHRVVDNFMVQGGDPEGSGRGGPGYRFADEIDSSLKHTGPGILSMANAGPGTNGSQFFITHIATPWLDGKHTVFGKVITGIDVVNAITQGDKIDSIRIKRVGTKAEAFKADQGAFDSLITVSQKKLEEAGSMKKKDQVEEIKKKFPTAIATPSGLCYIVLTKPTEEKKPKPGMSVKVHYTGTLLNGKKFDSSVDRNEPFEFNVGEGEVIRGWDEGLLDMSKGEKRTLILPSELGYGSRGAGGAIPPNAILVFDVELIDFK